MADGVDIDIYENLEDFNQQEGDFNHEGIDLYDDVITAPSGEGEPPAAKPASAAQPQVPTGAWTGKRIALYVGNLTWWTTDQNLTDAISSLGVTDLVEIKFYENRANGQSKGFAVVTLGSDASYKVVMDRLPGKELHGQNPVVTQCNRNALNQFEQQSRKPDQPGQGGKAFRDYDGPRNPAGRGRGGFVPRGPRPSLSPGPQGPPGPHNNHGPPPGHHGPPPGHHGPPPPRPGPPPHHQGPPPPRPGPPPPGHMGGPPPGMPPRGPPHPGGPRGPPPPDHGPRGPPPGPPRPDWDHGHRPPAPPFHPGPPPPNHHPGGPPPGHPGHPGGPPPPRPGPPPPNPYPGPPPLRQPGPPGHPPHMGPPPQGPPPPHAAPPAPHVNPAFFPPTAQPPPVQAPPPVQPDPYGRGPPPVSYPSDIYNSHRPPPERHERDRDPLTPSISEQEFEDMLEQNKTIMRSAIDKVVKDARQGKYASAIETLVTAISLIKQSKIANDDRCKICITSLQDTLHGVESKLYGSEVSSRERRSRSWSRDRDRGERHDERDREKRSRHRSRSREREKATTSSTRSRDRSERYHDERSSRHRDGDRDRDRDREREGERYSSSTSSRRH